MAWGVPKLGTLVEDATGDFTLVEPAGVAEGDLMIACIAYRGNAAITLTGWSAVATAQNSGDTDATNGIASGAMYYVVRGSSAPNLNATRTAGDVVLARVISYTPSANTYPVYDTGSANTLASASATVTTGTITTATANELIVAMTSGGDNYSASAFDAATDPTTASGATDTTTAPTAGTWIERQDSGTGTGADCGLAIADAVRATAGATGTIQATLSGSGRSVMIAGAFKEVARAFTQAEAAFYEDGTEAGSTVIDTGADSITRDVSSDSNILLRVRLQETNASNGVSTDDYQLQYELNDSGTYLSVGSSIDTYYFDGSDAAASDPNNVWTNETNMDDGSIATSGTTTTLGSVSSNFVIIEGTNAPSSGGTISQVRARMYAKGDVGTITEAVVYTDSLAEDLGLVSGTVNTGPEYGDYITLSTPSGGWTWAKVQALETKIYQSTTSATSQVHLLEIEVTSAHLEVVGFNSTNLTDGNATTNRLGSGTGSFVAGEISEDGLVDNLQITASNYTELLYALTVVSAEVADADTLDFRVLRNGATTGMTYTVTPRITVSKGGSAVITGTITPSATETDIVTGGKTIIITLTGDTWIAAGTGPIGSTANTQALIDGITSAQSEAAGWNAVVRAGIETTDVVRTSDTVATITLDAEATYNITANETITVTIPAAVLTGGAQIVASPTFTITATVTSAVRDIIGSGILPFAR